MAARASRLDGVPRQPAGLSWLRRIDAFGNSAHGDPLQFEPVRPIVSYEHLRDPQALVRRWPGRRTRVCRRSGVTTPAGARQRTVIDERHGCPRRVVEQIAHRRRFDVAGHALCGARCCRSLRHGEIRFHPTIVWRDRHPADLELAWDTRAVRNAGSPVRRTRPTRVGQDRTRAVPAALGDWCVALGDRLKPPAVTRADGRAARSCAVTPRRQRISTSWRRVDAIRGDERKRGRHGGEEQQGAGEDRFAD